MALVTTARAQLDPLLATLDSTLLASYLEAATDTIENYCDRVFTRDDFTESLDGNGLPVIMIKNTPINTLTSVVITDGSGTETTITSSNLDFDADSGRIAFDEDNSSSYVWFPKGFQNVDVNYDGGYTNDGTTNSIPDAVQTACLIIARNLAGISLTAKDPTLKGEKMGEYSYTKGSSVETTTVEGNSAVMSLLSGYVSLRSV